MADPLADGVLDKAELVDVMGEKQGADFFNAADKNGDGVVDADEYVAQKRRAEEEAAATSEEEAASVRVLVVFDAYAFDSIHAHI